MKRRVTVHFGDVRVVVPCRDENTTVADLAEAAIIRYKKATGKVRRAFLLMNLSIIFRSAGWSCYAVGVLFFTNSDSLSRYEFFIVFFLYLLVLYFSS
ncbi:unnamed protein product [Nippostrongylus brasiliensis]|uniref:Par3_HAL_N_term domain-containing protein n=1 Tax=Nippostrongylus brasiliensis TaxID=27835 RepID=A0A0N4XJ75_NIPBR|nr:unnamed protein product [Nippostrongylus brasiliensis]